MASATLEPKLTLAAMRELVLDEMEYIPRRPKEQQSRLRLIYWSMRMNSLGKKGEIPNDKHAVMKQCLAEPKKLHPDEEYVFDREYFGFKKRG